MDDDNNKTLSINEFTKACKDFRVGLSFESVQVLFEAFDINRDGVINYDEFLRQIRGPLNSFRAGLVEKAFHKIDKDGSGILDIADIKGTYNASKHPDVISGKKSEDEILVEFLETFEAHHNMMNGAAADGRITLDEFMEYYTNVGANLDNDDYFALMINNSWNITGDANTYKSHKKAWAGKDEKPEPVKRYPQEPVQRSGQMSQANPLVNTHQYYKVHKSAVKQGSFNAMYEQPPIDAEDDYQLKKRYLKEIREQSDYRF